MSFSLKPSALAVKVFLASISCSVLPSYADDAPEPIIDFEVITITHQRHQGVENNEDFAQGKTSEADLANWLSSVPGANINRNGAVTGIAQYRGLYGDRVAISLDGHPVIGAGPNAMDTPLSYSTPLIVDSMAVYRGVVPVAAGIDTLAGSIAVKMRKAEITQQDKLHTNGDLQTGYRSSNQAKTLASVVNVSKDNLGMMLYANLQSGKDMESGNGKSLAPTAFEKRQFGTDIRYENNSAELGLSYHYTDTQDSGTPALPMDIEYIFSHRTSVDGQFMLNDWQTTWTLGFVDADHGMTNFLMREKNDPMKNRRNNADAKSTDFSFSMQKGFVFGELEFGLDGYLATHDSVITNPNNTMFKVVNFNNVRDDRLGFYVQWQQQFDDTNVQFGTRIKNIKSDADETFTSMAMMSMTTMGQLASGLQNDFNQADRSVTDTLVDVSLNIETQLSNDLSANVGLGIKNRAASYQERYLWTPMESTGGLADGNTYIGDINLKAETAYQIDLGLNYQIKKFAISPHVFYQNINDYIQGTALGMTDMSAKMIAKMMSGDENPLKFTNVDARLSGIDVNWRYQFNQQFQLSGVASYVRGKRRDVNDNLYRVAPLNAQVKIAYDQEDWMINTTLVAVVAQKHVSATNMEQKTAGYATINVDVQYYLNSEVTLRAGFDNLLDKNYQNHLGGYNRVQGSEIDVMARLPSSGLSAWAELAYSF